MKKKIFRIFSFADLTNVWNPKKKNLNEKHMKRSDEDQRFSLLILMMTNNFERKGKFRFLAFTAA